MSNDTRIPTVTEFKAAGYKISVEHRRQFKTAYIDPRTFKLTVKTVRKNRFEMGENQAAGVMFELLPKGGETVLTFTDPKSKVDISTFAECHPTENYSKKEGVKICRERLVNLIRVCAYHNEEEVAHLVEFIQKSS